MDAPCVNTVFGLLDKDGDGFVTADDLYEVRGRVLDKAQSRWRSARVQP